MRLRQATIVFSYFAAVSVLFVTLYQILSSNFPSYLIGSEQKTLYLIEQFVIVAFLTTSAALIAKKRERAVYLLFLSFGLLGGDIFDALGFFLSVGALSAAILLIAFSLMFGLILLALFLKIKEEPINK